MKTQFILLGSILYSQALSSCQRALVNEEAQDRNLSLLSILDLVTTVQSMVKFLLLTTVQHTRRAFATLSRTWWVVAVDPKSLCRTLHFVFELRHLRIDFTRIYHHHERLDRFWSLLYWRMSNLMRKLYPVQSLILWTKQDTAKNTKSDIQVINLFQSAVLRQKLW